MATERRKRKSRTKAMMVDFHSHILPGIDDGSASVDESLQLLQASAAQGISVMCATPHFYPTTDDPEHFFRRRSAAWEKLSGTLTEGLPRVVLGAEVYYFSGIAKSDIVGKLRIGDTGLLLLEMPFSRWTESMVGEIVSLGGRRGVTVMLAHIERYLKYQSSRTWDFLLANNVIMQSNADFFLDWRSRHKAQRMLRSGKIHVIGSDCHNMTQRTQRIGEALDAIGMDGRHLLKRNIKEILLRSERAGSV